jgi:hypothetical protein
VDRPPFAPCQDYPHCVNDTRDRNAFHDWPTALRFACRQVQGQRRRRWWRAETVRYSVRFDGRHWIVEKGNG